MKGFAPVAVAALLVGGCGAPARVTTTVAPVAPTTSTASAPAAVAQLVECPSIPYVVNTLPTRVEGQAADLKDIEVDEFTAIGGTRSVFWVDADGSLRIALIRGTLPPRDWPGEKGAVDIAGVRGVVGPFDEGMWVAAWFEGAGSDRCDLYTMVFYPPIEPAEVETTLRSITR
ncbi:MAG: hypothetical protein ACT4OP_13030 [Actinomycetota bacterium]